MKMTAQLEVALPDATPTGPKAESPPYYWSDLLARRNALALRREDLIPILHIDPGKYWTREDGSRPVGPNLVAELIAMENFVAERTAEILAEASADLGTTIVVDAIADQAAFTRRHAHARTRRDGIAYPAVLDDLAVGRAAAELTRRGHDVEVYRGERRADLAVRRLATGLLKAETATLLGMSAKKYYLKETGKDVPPAGLLAELQAIDDFITETAGRLEVIQEAGISVVLMLDDPSVFERTYPQARTLRDGRTYPMRVHRVAAGRRAGAIERESGNARIAVSA